MSLEGTGFVDLPDEKLYAHAERVRGKVVIITGTWHGYRQFEAVLIIHVAQQVVLMALEGMQLLNLLNMGARRNSMYLDLSRLATTDGRQIFPQCQSGHWRP